MNPFLIPNINPTRVPECEISEASGKLFLPELNLCLKLELWTEGNLDMILTSLSNIECTEDLAGSQLTQTLSTWISATSAEVTYARVLTMVP